MESEVTRGNKQGNTEKDKGTTANTHKKEIATKKWEPVGLVETKWESVTIAGKSSSHLLVVVLHCYQVFPQRFPLCSLCLPPPIDFYLFLFISILFLSVPYDSWRFVQRGDSLFGFSYTPSSKKSFKNPSVSTGISYAFSKREMLLLLSLSYLLDKSFYIHHCKYKQCDWSKKGIILLMTWEYRCTCRLISGDFGWF